MAIFYFPHMKYGKVLVSLPENQKNFFAFFHFLGLIIPKNMLRAKKKFPSVTRRCRRRR
jgi:hypothetical protein